MKAVYYCYMTKTLFILGRQPIFGLAEIESLFPNDNIEQINEKIIAIDKSIDANLINRLGGTIKIAEEITSITGPQDISLEQLVTKTVLDSISSFPKGKINFGISYYGSDQTTRDIEKIAINIKRFVKKTGRSIRVIPNNDIELSSAQIFHNKLTNKTGFELIVIKNQNTITLARSFAVQNIESYTSRDQKRPYRDAKIGMLPPKLAQIMINLLNPATGTLLLDPFCGTGVILQESLLIGLSAIGTDIDHRMVEYSTNNIDWLKKKFNLPNICKISYGDATNNVWNDKIDNVVSEIYLGRPFFQVPSLETINKENNLVNELLVKFLINLHPQINTGTKLCLAIPAWRYDNSFLRLPILDQLEKIGYNPMSFKNLNPSDLIYFRPNQIVARQMLLLTRK